MATTQVVGATSHGLPDWHSIDWQRVNGNVRRLQTRIVQATQAGRWGKVNALQRLLTHSFSGKALAVRRVTENQGKRTAGVDGETWETPAKKAAALHTLTHRGYQPRPLRRVYIPKKHGKRRPLGIPTMRDRTMQALHLLALAPIAETTADPHSYGFRSERCTADAIEQCFNVLAPQRMAQWILEGDIKACFDRISHGWLLDNVPMDKPILRKWLQAGFMEHHVFYPSDSGTPQGGIISPTLANLALDGLEGKLREAFPKTTRQGKRAKVNLVRYADDFVITGASSALLTEEVQPLVEYFLRERGLELSPEKTRITHIEDGFDFLGQNVRKYKSGTQHKLLIKPSKQNVHTFLAKVRGIIKANKQLAAGKLIRLLNPIIRGWAQYHRHIVSKHAFGSVNHAIYERLWQWARRRHPQKSGRWVQQKYFTTIGGNHWVFYGEEHAQTIWLFNPASVPIRRHITIRAAANPFDRAWDGYFEQRLGVKMASTLRGRRQLLFLWKEQQGRCLVCAQKITELTGWHNHHVTWRSKGGADTAANRVLLHPACHTRVHSQGLYVEKPRPNRGE